MGAKAAALLAHSPTSQSLPHKVFGSAGSAATLTPHPPASSPPPSLVRVVGQGDRQANQPGQSSPKPGGALGPTMLKPAGASPPNPGAPGVAAAKPAVATDWSQTRKPEWSHTTPQPAGAARFMPKAGSGVTSGSTAAKPPNIATIMGPRPPSAPPPKTVVARAREEMGAAPPGEAWSQEA